VGRTVNGQTWQYLYGSLGNTFQITATCEPSGTLTVYYYDTGSRLYALERGEAWYYVATDQVGTPKVVTNAAGNEVRALEYDSFGCLVSDSNPDFYLPIGFAGGLADPDTGLVRYGFRDYDPAAGRWTAKDPIFFAGGQGNLYAYCGSDPMNYFDPSGLDKQTDEVARRYDLDPRKFGDYLEELKELEGREGADNYTPEELEERAEQCKSEGKAQRQEQSRRDRQRQRDAKRYKISDIEYLPAVLVLSTYMWLRLLAWDR
jgi:RHS repeat-associated protein